MTQDDLQVDTEADTEWEDVAVELPEFDHEEFDESDFDDDFDLDFEEESDDGYDATGADGNLL